MVGGGEVGHPLVDAEDSFRLSGDGADLVGKRWFVMAWFRDLLGGVEGLLPWCLPSLGKLEGGVAHAFEIGGGGALANSGEKPGALCE